MTSIPKVLNLWNWNTLSLKKKFRNIRVPIEHVSTNLMIVDPLTKGLSPKLCTDHVKNMGIMCTSECWMVNVIINDYLILWVHYCASFWNPYFLLYEYVCKLWLWCRKKIMLLMMKDDIMFEPIIEFSLWGHIKEKDDTVVHGRKCVDWMTCDHHDSYYSYIFKYDEWWNQFIEGPLMRIMIY